MGARGAGFFEDDTNCDFVADLIEMNASPDSFGRFFEKGIREDYLGYDEGAEIIVCGALIDALLNNTELKCFTEGIDEWLEKNKVIPIVQLKPVAVSALQKVIGEESELNELWMENEEEYPNWKGNITGLIERLSK